MCFYVCFLISAKICLFLETTKDLKEKSLLCIVLDFTGFVELLFHRGVLVGELANGEIFYLVVGKAEVVVGLEEVVLHFLEVGDGLVDGCDGIMESVVGVLDVVAKEVAELVELLLEIGDIDFLALGKDG